MSFYLTPAQTKRRRFILRLKLYFLFLIIPLIFIGIFYFLNTADFWHIKNFVIMGNKRLSSEQIMANLKPMVITSPFGKFFGLNHYLSWFGFKDVYLKGPEFASLVISSDLQKKEVIISVEEKEPYGVWCLQTQTNADNTQTNADSPRELAAPCWWFDKEGVVFETAPYSEGALIYRVSDSSDAPLVLGSRVLEEKYFKYLRSIFESMKSLEVSVGSFDFERKLQEITVYLPDGTRILFSLRFDPQSNINALRMLKEKEGLENIEYIDLRVENRIYLK